MGACPSTARLRKGRNPRGCLAVLSWPQKADRSQHKAKEDRLDRQRELETINREDRHGIEVHRYINDHYRDRQKQTYPRSACQESANDECIEEDKRTPEDFER